MPNFQILETLAHYATCTPDFIDLSQSSKNEFIVFVYDNVKFGELNHKVLGTCNYYGRASTMMPHFNLRHSGNVATGFYFQNGRTEDGDKVSNIHMSHIFGELYGVSLRTLTDLDFLMSNGVAFHRIEKWFTPFDQRDNAIQGFMYTGDHKYWGGYENIMSKLKRCPDTDISGHNGFYFGDDPRTLQERVIAEEEEMFEDYGGRYGGYYFGRGYNIHAV